MNMSVSFYTPPWTSIGLSNVQKGIETLAQKYVELNYILKQRVAYLNIIILSNIELITCL